MSTHDDRAAPSHPAKPMALNFLNGGGEMGAIIRAYDWASTPLGPPGAWPQPLKTAVRLLLSTGHPMFLWWGPDLIQFYNDAYRQSIGPERHPSAIGQKGRDCWAEIWEIIGPQIGQVMSGGGPTWHENQLVPITRNGRREDVYWTYSYGPVDDESAPNGVGGVLVVCNETTQVVLAQRMRTAQAEQWRRVFEQAPGFICILRGPEHVFEFVNIAHRRLFGSDSWVGKTVRDAFPDLTGQGFYEFLDQVYGTGEQLVFKDTPVRYRREPGGPEEVRYLDFIYAPVIDDDGRVNGIFCEGFEVTETRKAQQAVRENEEQLRLATEAAEIGLWDVDVVSDTLFWPPRVKAMFGISPDVPVSMADFYAGLHPDDCERVALAFEATLDPERRALYDVEYRTVGKEDGVVRWVAAKGRALFDEDGACVRVIGTAIDISARKAAEEHLRLMVNELNHRVKNSLATVQAIAAQTLRRDEVPEAVRESLTARLIALAKAHDVLTDEKWSGAGLHEMAHQAVAPYAPEGGARRFDVVGPPINLPPKSAIAIALAFHELATNAAKYGALSIPGGRVQIGWSIAAGPGGELRLKVRWQETGGPPVQPPESTGFGTRLVERALAAELQGVVKIIYPPSGVVCTIDALITSSVGTPAPVLAPVIGG